MKLFRLCRHRDTTQIFLTEKNIQQMYHIVAHVCVDCHKFIKVEAIKNSEHYFWKGKSK